MELDINSKIALQIGSLMLTNIQLAHQLQHMQAEAEAKGAGTDSAPNRTQAPPESPAAA